MKIVYELLVLLFFLGLAIFLVGGAVLLLYKILLQPEKQFEIKGILPSLQCQMFGIVIMVLAVGVFSFLLYK